MAALMVFMCLAAVVCVQPIYTYTTRTEYRNPMNTQWKTTLLTTKASPIYREGDINKLQGEIMNLHSQINDLQQKYTELKMQVSSHGADSFVAFEARLSNSLMGLGGNQIVLFDNVLMNKGNGYDNRIGVFRCPLNGTYQLTLSVACFGRIQLELVNNGVKVGHLFAAQRRTRLPISKRDANYEEHKKRQVYPSGSPLITQSPGILTPTRAGGMMHGSEAATASIQFLVDLVVGDDVWVRHLDNGLNAVLLSDIYTTFSGHLIHS